MTGVQTCLFRSSEVAKNGEEMRKIQADTLKTMTAAQLDAAKVEEIGAKIGLDIDRAVRESVLAAMDMVNQPQQQMQPDQGLQGLAG